VIAAPTGQGHTASHTLVISPLVGHDVWHRLRFPWATAMLSISWPSTAPFNILTTCSNPAGEPEAPDWEFVVERTTILDDIGCSANERKYWEE
jgi:hypothetical protein